MTGTSRTRPSQLAETPDDVTDPLLWRLALDVADAHQPGADGRCTNTLCAGENGPCNASRYVQRAMRSARPGASAAPEGDAVHRHAQPTDRDHNPVDGSLPATASTARRGESTAPRDGSMPPSGTPRAVRPAA